MRRVTMVAAAAVLIGWPSFVSAADLSFKDPPYTPTPSVALWGGLYVGGHLGGFWGSDPSSSAQKNECIAWQYDCGRKSKCAETAWKNTKEVSFDESDDVSFIGGVHVGYNMQHNSAVFGVEADVDFGDQVDHLASLRGRLGYATGNLLIYGTAGVALAAFNDDPFQFKIGNKSFAMKADNDDSELGFVIGGGVDYALNTNWSVGLEGLYYMFDDHKSEATVTSGGDTFKVSHEEDGDMFVVRARVSYHLQSQSDVEPIK